MVRVCKNIDNYLQYPVRCVSSKKKKKKILVKIFLEIILDDRINKIDTVLKRRKKMEDNLSTRIEIIAKTLFERNVHLHGELFKVERTFFCAQINGPSEILLTPIIGSRYSKHKR